MSANLETVFQAVRELPLEQQEELIEKIKANLKTKKSSEEEVKKASSIVERTRGRMKGLDRETLIYIAEDEEFCGY